MAWTGNNEAVMRHAKTRRKKFGTTNKKFHNINGIFATGLSAYSFI